MTDIILPTPEFLNGTTADGPQVQLNFEAITDVVNGSIDDSNLSDDGITASSKIKDGTVLAAQIADANIRANHIDWTSVNLGVRGWRTNGYAGANGNRLVRIEKTIAITAVTTQQSFDIDWSAGDAPDGSVTFLSAPTIVGLEILDTGGLIAATDPDAIAFKKVSARSTTGCTVKITFSNAPTAGNVVLMGLVAGAA